MHHNCKQSHDDHGNPLKSVKIQEYQLIYAKNLKLSGHLDILHADA